MKKTDPSVPTAAEATAGPPIDLAAAWTYAQKTGDLQQDGKHVSTGYSGASEGKNNTAMDNVSNVAHRSPPDPPAQPKAKIIPPWTMSPTSAPSPAANGRSRDHPSTARTTAPMC